MITILDPEGTWQRFVSKIDFDGPNGCHLWTGTRNPKGYGSLGVEERHAVPAHILSLGFHEMMTGVDTWFPGAQADHLCFVRHCVNPEHLRWVTARANQQHRKGASRTSKTGVRGVSWDKRTGKYFVTVGHMGHSYFGGRFLTLEEADSAAQSLRLKLYGPDHLGLGA